MDGTEYMKDRAARMTNLANAEALDYVDWLEITQVGRGQHGMYVVSKKGVRPKKFAQDFLDTLPGVTVFERVPLTGSDDAVLRGHSLPRQQEVEALRAIEECPWTLRFPCTPGELLEFVDRAEYGGRHFSVPQAFRDAVSRMAVEKKKRARKVPAHFRKKIEETKKAIKEAADKYRLKVSWTSFPGTKEDFFNFIKWHSQGRHGNESLETFKTYLGDMGSVKFQQHAKPIYEDIFLDYEAPIKRR